MNLKINLSRYCSQEKMAQGAAICKAGQLSHIVETAQANNTVKIAAKVTDCFHFVDHPELTVDRSGREIICFSCDCKDYHNARGLCAHCAALALSINAQSEQNADVLHAECAEGQPDLDYNDQFSVGPQLMQLSYSFCNSAADMYPGETAPIIPLERFQMMFGQTAQAMMLFIQNKDWGGSCFGVSSTSAMFHTAENAISVADFCDSAARPSQLGLEMYHTQWGISLRSFIEAMQISQFSYSLSAELNRNYNNEDTLDEICRRVRSFEQSGQDPIVLGIFGKIAGQSAGHAVLPYRIEELDESTSKLHIYDPNSPQKDRWIDLTRRDDGHITDWRYNDMFSEGREGVSFYHYETYLDAWNQRGGLTPRMAALSVAREVSVWDADENCVLKVTDQEVIPYRDDIVVNRKLTGTTNISGDTVLVWITPGAYTVRNECEDRESLSVQVADVNQLAALNTTAREVSVTVCDDWEANVVSIAEADAKYTIKLYSTLENTHRDVLAEGMTGEEGITLAQVRGTLYAYGLSEKCNNSFHIDGNLAQRSCFRNECPVIEEMIPIKDNNNSLNAEHTEDIPDICNGSTADE